MKNNMRFMGTSLRFLVCIFMAFTLCLGGVWTVLLNSFPDWTPTLATIPQETVPKTLEALNTTERISSENLQADNSQASFPIPVTGTSCLNHTPPQTGRVVNVVDGDTITVLLDQDAQTYQVRYIGIDAPTGSSQIESLGSGATAKNVELVYNKDVLLFKDISDTDPNGRLLRYVTTDTIFVNYGLVRQGYAETNYYPPDISCILLLQEAEQQAAASRLGLWADPPTHAGVPTIPAPGEGNARCACGVSGLNCFGLLTHLTAHDCDEYCQKAGDVEIFGLDGYVTGGFDCESLP